MANLLEFLEQMGSNARLRTAAGEDMARVLTEAGMADDVRHAILTADQTGLESLLGASANVFCSLHTPGEDEETPPVPTPTPDDTEEQPPAGTTRKAPRKKGGKKKAGKKKAPSKAPKRKAPKKAPRKAPKKKPAKRKSGQAGRKKASRKKPVARKK